MSVCMYATMLRAAVESTCFTARRMIVVPGLINAHQHFYYHLFKGAANGLLIVKRISPGVIR